MNGPAGADPPRVSVIMPAFNAAATLADTVASVQAQTYPHWELILAEDGSTDDTLAVAQALAAADPRIRVLPPEGPTGLPARARNRALRAARGDYLAFLDADDRWRPEKLARQVEWLEAHPASGGVCCWHGTFGDPGRVRTERFRRHTGAVCTRHEALTGVPFMTLTLMIRRQVYDAIGGMDEDPRLFSTEDADYFLRLVSHCRVDRLHAVLADYYLAPAAAPSISQAAATADNAKGWALTAAWLEKGLLTPAEHRQRRAYLYYERARGNLHRFGGPFRGDLLRAVGTGAAPWQAVVTLALCWLPRTVLARLLHAALDWRTARSRFASPQG